MSIRLGVHSGPQDLSMDELRRIWRRADESRLHWVSVWDHFYANPLVDRANPCFEGVAAMSALAATTEHVRVGCLVFCALFRNPGLLAKAAVTIDHISNGRCELGIGAGWFEEEFNDYGYTFPPIGRRLDQLEEALAVVRSLLRDEQTDFKGEFYTFQGAVCAPKPVNPNLRIWVGGRGPKRTPKLAARYADGFNVPYPSPEEFRDRLESVDRECDSIGRDPSEIERTVNLGFYMSDDPNVADARARELQHVQGGVLIGSVQQVVDRIGEYERAGAQGLNIAFRPPVDWDAYERFLAEVAPVFHGR